MEPSGLSSVQLPLGAHGGWTSKGPLQPLPFCDSEIQKNVPRVMGLCFQGENSSADFFSFLSLSYQPALK